MSCLGKTFQPELACVAVSAGSAGCIRVVTAHGLAIIDAEGKAEFDDAPFREIEEWGANMHSARVFYTGSCGEVRHLFEGGDVVWATVGVSAVVQAVHADKDVCRVGDFGESERVGEKDRVAGRDVGNRNFGRPGRVVCSVNRAVFGDGDVGCERGSAEYAKIDVDHFVAGNIVSSSDCSGDLDLLMVALSILKGKRVYSVVFAGGERE